MEDCSPQQLSEALLAYRKKYGNGEIDMFKLEELIRAFKIVDNIKKKGKKK